MPTITSTIVIGAPPEAVTEALLDADLAPAWTAGLERLELVSGQPGEVGCVGRAHYAQDGKPFTLLDTLEEATPNRRYVSRLSGGQIEATVETTLEPLEGNATRLTVRWTGRARSVITRITLALMRRTIAKRADVDLQSLRRLVETRR